MRLLATVVAIVVIIGGLLTILTHIQSQADIICSTDYPKEISTTSNCQVYVKNVGESHGSFTLTVTSNNFILSGGSPEPRYRSDNELRFATYALMSGERTSFTFTISVSENLPKNASYTIRLNRHTLLRWPIEKTFNYAFDGSKYVFMGRQ